MRLSEGQIWLRQGGGHDGGEALAEVAGHVHDAPLTAGHCLLWEIICTSVSTQCSSSHSTPSSNPEIYQQTI